MFKCSYCNYISDRKFNLSTHINNKHNTNIFNKIHNKNGSETTNVIEKAKNVIENQCYKCKKLFTRKYYLNVHINKCKGLTNPCQCHKCHKIFSSRSNKCNHLKICKEQEPIDSSMMVSNNPLTQPIIQTLNNITNNNNTTNINNGTIINNTIIFQENPNKITEFIKDNITLQMLCDIIGTSHKDYSMILENFFRHICDTEENMCVKKTNIKSKYLSVKTGNDRWDTKLDKTIMPKLTKDISYNFMNMIDDDKYESPLVKKFKNEIIANIRDNILQVVHRYEGDAFIDDIDKQVSKEVNLLADRLTSVIIDKTKNKLQ